MTNSVIFEGDLSVFLDAAEERGVVGEAELETLAFEHDLDDDELAALRAELAVREVEIVAEERHDECRRRDDSGSAGPGGGRRHRRDPTRSPCS